MAIVDLMLVQQKQKVNKREAIIILKKGVNFGV